MSIKILTILALSPSNLGSLHPKLALSGSYFRWALKLEGQTLRRCLSPKSLFSYRHARLMRRQSRAPTPPTTGALLFLAIVVIRAATETMESIINNVTKTMDEAKEDPIALWSDLGAMEGEPDLPEPCPLTPQTGLDVSFSLTWLKQNEPSLGTGLEGSPVPVPHWIQRAAAIFRPAAWHTGNNQFLPKPPPPPSTQTTATL